MVYDPRSHHRRSIRLRGYNYAGGGAYFVTICTHVRECLFGQIMEGEMTLDEADSLVQRTWEALPQRLGSLLLDVFQIMPNHLHAVFVLPGIGLEPSLAKATGAPVVQPSAGGRGRASPNLVNPRQNNPGAPGRGAATHNEGTPSRPPTAMGDVVGAFKSICTITVNKLIARTGTRLLHENYYEHIIRDVGELEAIREYIVAKPQCWLEDPENPARL